MEYGLLREWRGKLKNREWIEKWIEEPKNMEWIEKWIEKVKNREEDVKEKHSEKYQHFVEEP